MANPAIDMLLEQAEALDRRDRIQDAIAVATANAQAITQAATFDPEAPLSLEGVAALNALETAQNDLEEEQEYIEELSAKILAADARYHAELAAEREATAAAAKLKRKAFWSRLFGVQS